MRRQNGLLESVRHFMGKKCSKEQAEIVAAAICSDRVSVRPYIPAPTSCWEKYLKQVFWGVAKAASFENARVPRIPKSTWNKAKRRRRERGDLTDDPDSIREEVNQAAARRRHRGEAGRLTVKEFADEHGLAHSTVGNTVRRLEKQGFIKVEREGPFGYLTRRARNELLKHMNRRVLAKAWFRKQLGEDCTTGFLRAALERIEAISPGALSGEGPADEEVLQQALDGLEFSDGGAEMP